MSEPDFYNLIARERGMPPGWRWYQLEAVPKFFASKAPDRKNAACIVRGAVCTATITRGPRKGETNWAKRDRSTDHTIVITFADYDARVAAWKAGEPCENPCGDPVCGIAGGGCLKGPAR